MLVKELLDTAIINEARAIDPEDYRTHININYINKDIIHNAADLKIELQDMGFKIRDSDINTIKREGILFSVYIKNWAPDINKLSDADITDENYLEYLKIVKEYGFISSPKITGIGVFRHASSYDIKLKKFSVVKLTPITDTNKALMKKVGLI